MHLNRPWITIEAAGAPAGRGGRWTHFMKRAAIFTISIILLVLCYAALDDITTGSQLHYVLEWMFVSLTLVWFVGLIAFTIIRRKGDRSG